MEENAKKFNLNKKMLLLGGGVIALVLVVVLIALMLPGNIHKELTVEAGRDTITANDFRKEDRGLDAQFVSDMTAVDLNTPGVYPVKVQYKSKTYDCTLTVEDTLPPEAVVQNLAVYSNQTLNPEDFVVSVNDASAVTVTISPEPDLTKEAQTLMTVTVTDAAGNRSEYEAVLSVYVDNGQPQLSGVEAMFTYIGTEPDYLANVTAMDDRDMALEIIVDKSKVDLSSIGTYDVTYSVTDAAGNTTTAATTVTVTDDNVPPTILGVHDISLYLGSAASYRSGVEVRDDKDSAPKLEVDSSQVDLSTPGTYPLVYTARDMTGNETRMEVTVTVAEKPNTYVEPETIEAKADELLKKIVTEGMNDEAKVKAIYSYVRSHYTYSGHSDKTDWMQGAYTMMTDGQGDCFNYFAVAKLLLERCGIPNIDVRKVRNHETDSDHYWSLVSVDGGSTYYHLDTTPRVGDGDDFCLVTDAFLDAYSDTHGKCHNRDKALYPRTPEA
ncbi:MAG: transglutaminase domain-containing protein [Oscillospiraceae bacterium]|nr:transglutaminase domain-containing protein [Oscillospiraceae bacterium]